MPPQVLMVGEGGGGVRRADEAADTAPSQAACRQLEAQVAQLQQDLRKASVARAQARSRTSYEILTLRVQC